MKVFGVDLLLNFPESADAGNSGEVPIPRVTILEYNASPDFHQSGERLRPHLAELFHGVVKLSIAPFFNLHQDDEEDAEPESQIGDEKYGWRLVGQGEIRGPGA